MRIKIYSSLLIVAFSALTINSSAQTAKEVFELYNTTATTYKQDFAKGITNFNKLIELSDQVGEECAEIKSKTEKLIPRVYFEYAMSLYKAKDLQGTLNNLELAEDMAIKYSDPDIKKRVEKTLPKLYNVMGTNKLGEEKFDEALSNYEKALLLNPNFIDAQVNTTAVYQKMGDEQKMIESLQKTYELAKKLNKVDIADDVNTRLKNVYLKKAEENRVASKFDEAIENYEKSISYDSTDAVVYRNFSNACFQAEKWEKTIVVAAKAIDLNKGTDIDKAEIYHELATSYHKINNIEKACETYKKAAFGEFKPNADYQIKTLKCQ